MTEGVTPGCVLYPGGYGAIVIERHGRIYFAPSLGWPEAKSAVEQAEAAVRAGVYRSWHSHLMSQEPQA